MPDTLQYLEFGATREEAELCVILMHGLGADGHAFADVAQAHAGAAQPRKWRFVLPHAPSIPVTINTGMSMPAWYDILDMSHTREVDWETVAQSHANIDALLEEECAQKVVLAGFSQGGAMALHVGLRRQEPVAGILVMSGYLLENDTHPCPAKDVEIPIGFFHGSADPVVPLIAAETAASTLGLAGFEHSFRIYEGMQHSVCDEEIRDVFAWLDGLG